MTSTPESIRAPYTSKYSMHVEFTACLLLRSNEQSRQTTACEASEMVVPQSVFITLFLLVMLEIINMMSNIWTVQLCESNAHRGGCDAA